MTTHRRWKKLNFARHYADHLKRNSRNQNGFSDGRTAAEELLAQASAQEYDTAALQFVEGIEPTAFGGDFVAHLAIFRTNATHRRGS